MSTINRKINFQKQRTFELPQTQALTTVQHENK